MNPALERQAVLFREALRRASGPEREAFLDQACAGDPALRARLKALLDAHASPDSFLESPVGAPAATAPIESVPQEGPGTLIGRYKLLEKVGEGGFGAVYVAEQQEPVKRRVALKIIKLGMDTRQVVARFEAERQALALMDHPNIAKVLDAGATETGRPFFVMDLVRGTRITDYCDENQLSTEERLNLFVQVCHAIQHAHQKGIIHRDIKPSNILVTINDGVPVPKVIDFGIAKATQGELTDKTVYTQLHQFIGTPAYMSPEQAVMTSLDVDTRSDIYGLGVLLYELLIGTTPFGGQELLAAGWDEMRRIIREQEPMRPSTRLSTLSHVEQTTVARRRHLEPPQLVHLVHGDLDWIVMKCLEKDRARRYETANGVADDVTRHLKDEPVLARPPGRVYRLQKLVRRNKLVFAAGAAVAGAVVVGLGLSTWLFFREQAARLQAVSAEKTQGELRQQAQAEAKKSEQVARVWKNMLQGVGPSVAMGRDITLLKEILDKTAEGVSNDLKDQPEVAAELRSTIGDVYFALDQYTNAETMHRLALSIRRGLWGNLNTNVADSLDAVGRAIQWQGWQGDRAEPFFQEALNIRTNLLGTEHPAIAASLYNLGWVRADQARISEAERLFRESLAMRRKLLGNDRVEAAETLGALTYALNAQGRPGESEAAAREALAIWARRSGGKPVWDAQSTYARLGLALYLQHKLGEAEVVLRQSLESCRNVLGLEHGTVVDARMALALVLVEKGELEEAEPLAREAFAASKRLPADHQAPYMALSLETLGRALRKAGKWAEAESAFREVLEVLKQHPSPIGHEAQARSWLIAVLREQGKLAEIETIYREEVAAQRKASTKEARQREASLLAGWGDWLREQGRGAEAEPLYGDGLALCRQFVTNDFSLRQWLAGGLCTLLRNQGRLAEAEALGRETLEMGRKLPPSSRLARAICVLADVLRDEGKLDQAEPLYREGLELCRKIAPDDFEQRQWLAVGLGLSLRTQGKLAEAEGFYREAITNAAKVWPNNVARWQWQVSDLAEVLRSLGKSGEADSLEAQMLKPDADSPSGQITALQTRIDLCGRRGQWKDAAANLYKLLELDPSRAYSHLQLAAVLVETGELAAYRTHCRGMLARFGGTNDAIIADQTAKACLLVPGSAGDLETASHLAAKAVSLGQGNAWFSFLQMDNGLAEYRQGQYASVVDSMRKVIGQPMIVGRPLPMWQRDVAAYSVLAMAQHRLKRTEEARAALARASEFAQTKLPQAGHDNLEQDWVDWLIAHILLREARVLVNGNPGTTGQ